MVKNLPKLMPSENVIEIVKSEFLIHTADQ